MTGVELLKLSLQVKGPGALQLLQGGTPAPAGGAAAAAVPAVAADSLAQWHEVAARLHLSSAQAAAVLAWRDAFLQRLDELYGQRLLLKAQLAHDLAGAAVSPRASAQAAGAPTPPAWAEALLLQGAASAGYAAPAAAGVALGDLLAGLQANLMHEREAVGGLLEQLLTGGQCGGRGAAHAEPRWRSNGTCSTLSSVPFPWSRHLDARPGCTLPACWTPVLLERAGLFARGGLHSVHAAPACVDPGKPSPWHVAAIM